ncbi:S8 family serine peptidase [Pseudarthrobacter sp. NamE5]|uniref:S8 family serine peptidase n=1 Tax=Pseudarthrobacter sp. NamE5 TaxID=2576839 RepID=UPI00110AAB2F|nr:S8 family serine peptidase [Pseudarthrobacter sp. NamE5]TLM83457.1 S8 family peptidase [Pseudarthrobacter sp. NamE5]
MSPLVRRPGLLMLLTVLSVTCAGVTAGNAAPDPSQAAVGEGPQGAKARYIVKYADGTDPAVGERALHARKLPVGRTFSAALRGAVVTATPAQAEELRTAGEVAAVEIDAPVTVANTGQTSLWGLDRIDQRKLPLSGSYTPGASGAGVSAYVLDTGVLATHTEFAGRVATGWTVFADGKGTADCSGHGTHVAGTLGGKTYGVAKEATLIPVRVLDCAGFGYISDLVAGLDWVARHHTAGTPAVANLSVRTPFSAMLDSAVKGVIADGVTAVVAAGNAADDACNSSPSRLPEAITVAASDSSDRQASFSSFGPCVDLYAPGVGIKSTGHTSVTATATMGGTSMATPHVAGAAAVLLSQNPAMTPSAVAFKITADATTQTISGVGAGTPNRLLYLQTPAAAAEYTEAISAAAAASPGIGSPTGPVICGLAGGGCYQNYEGGVVHWSPATGARITKGAIRAVWAAQNWENGSLGYPTTNEIGGLKNGGVYQNFQGGVIHWSPASGAHITKGAIRTAWAALNWENGFLGYPTSNEITGLRNGGVYQNFQSGVIYWSPGSGAYSNAGAIRQAYAFQGWENGRLGYPVSNEIPSGSGVVQYYQGGHITWSALAGAAITYK